MNMNAQNKLKKLVAINLILTSATSLFYSQSAVAQDSAAASAHANRISLSASASVEVQQDWLSLSLGTTRDGADAATVQTQLKQALDAALAVARPQAEKDKLDVRTGNFSLSPRYGRDGKISGWQGSVDLVLEGRDFVRVSTTAAKVQTLTMQGMSFGLSPAARVALESDLQAQAIARFRAKAVEVAKSFGYQGYSLVQVNVGAVDGNGGGVRPMLAMSAKSVSSMADAPVPMEAGRSTVQLSVNGTVSLK